MKVRWKEEGELWVQSSFAAATDKAVTVMDVTAAAMTTAGEFLMALGTGVPDFIATTCLHVHVLTATCACVFRKYVVLSYFRTFVLPE